MISNMTFERVISYVTINLITVLIVGGFLTSTIDYNIYGRAIPYTTIDNITFGRAISYFMISFITYGRVIFNFTDDYLW